VPHAWKASSWPIQLPCPTSVRSGAERRPHRSRSRAGDRELLVRDLDHRDQEGVVRVDGVPEARAARVVGEADLDLVVDVDPVDARGTKPGPVDQRERAVPLERRRKRGDDGRLRARRALIDVDHAVEIDVDRRPRDRLDRSSAAGRTRSVGRHFLNDLRGDAAPGRGVDHREGVRDERDRGPAVPCRREVREDLILQRHPLERGAVVDRPRRVGDGVDDRRARERVADEPRVAEAPADVHVDRHPGAREVPAHVGEEQVLPLRVVRGRGPEDDHAAHDDRRRGAAELERDLARGAGRAPELGQDRVGRRGGHDPELDRREVAAADGPLVVVVRHEELGPARGDADDIGRRGHSAHVLERGDVEPGLLLDVHDRLEVGDVVAAVRRESTFTSGGFESRSMNQESDGSVELESWSSTDC
jgi:hypothetical protein